MFRAEVFADGQGLPGLACGEPAGWCLGRVASLPARWRAGRARRGGDRLAGVTIARLRGPAVFPLYADLFLIHFLQISRWTWRVQPALQM